MRAKPENNFDPCCPRCGRVCYSVECAHCFPSIAGGLLMKRLPPPNRPIIIHFTRALCDTETLADWPDDPASIRTMAEGWIADKESWEGDNVLADTNHKTLTDWGFVQTFPPLRPMAEVWFEQAEFKELLTPSSASSKEVSGAHIATPVSSIITALNLKCAAAGRKRNFDEAHRIAVLAGAVEDAIKEAGYWPELPAAKDNLEAVTP